MKKTLLILLLIPIGILYAQNSTKLVIKDTRSVNDLPNAKGLGIEADFKFRTTIGVPGLGTYSTNLTISPWTSADNSGEENHQLNFNQGGIFYRKALPLASDWSNWQQLILANSNGNVGIGTNNPNDKLTVEGIITSNITSNEGGALSLVNRTKTGNSATTWRIYNMTGNYGNSLQFWTYSSNFEQANSRLSLSDDGNMALYGKLEAKEIKVTESPTADFVFEENYALPSLQEVEKHIKEKKHLPEIASAKEMENDGVNIGEFQIKLLQKIEELTLYIIEQNKSIEKQNKETNKLNNTVLEQQKQIENLNKKLEQSLYEK